jgi:hypothetical protein
MLLAEAALMKGSSAARSAQLVVTDEASRRALEAAAEYMEAILDVQPKAGSLTASCGK